MIQSIDSVSKLSTLRIKEGYWYLASPYTAYLPGITAAAIDVSKVAGKLIKAKVPIFCPIAHSHCIALYSSADALDHALWMRADKPMMDAAHGLLIANMKGWDGSKGIKEEIEVFRAAGKPIYLWSGSATG